MEYFRKNVGPDTDMETLIQVLRKEWKASSWEEIFPEKCKHCGEKNVDIDQVIAISVVNAVTAGGEREHPVIKKVLEGYILEEEKGGQIELPKLEQAIKEAEALNFGKKKTTSGKVNFIKNNTSAQTKQTTKTNMQKTSKRETHHPTILVRSFLSEQ